MPPTIMPTEKANPPTNNFPTLTSACLNIIEDSPSTFDVLLKLCKARRWRAMA